ncbi:MAG TPA: VIT1/CCC1 transporter family protein [Candidatus Dormibacteraeota bacterium]|nr:VIT1/CCC1 transporter family protein [Candidatus Dormibacteraeota bacterium]
MATPPDRPSNLASEAVSEPAPAAAAGTSSAAAPPAVISTADRRRVVAQLRRNWQEEMRSSRLYTRLAATQADGDARQLLLEMAGHEQRHAEHWRRRLQQLGGRAPRIRPTPREIVLPLLARIAGLASVISLIEGGEARGKFDYMRQARLLPDAESRAIAKSIVPEERFHQGAAARLRGADDDVDSARRTRAGRAHLGDFLRDLIFGLNDGLVSNFSLIAGVSGANTSHGIVLLAGVAGVIAGAASMAAGAYLSNKSKRELMEEELRREAEEIEYAPEEERDELRRIYRLKGFEEDEVAILVNRITADKQRWLDVLITEELGLSPHPGPPPLADALFAGGGFAAGAIVPVIPFIFAGGTGSLIAAGVLSLFGLFAVGATKTLVTRRSPLRSGAEMVAVGVSAAVVTNLVGRLVGPGITT